MLYRPSISGQHNPFGGIRRIDRDSFYLLQCKGLFSFYELGDPFFILEQYSILEVESIPVVPAYNRWPGDHIDKTGRSLIVFLYQLSVVSSVDKYSDASFLESVILIETIYHCWFYTGLTIYKISFLNSQEPNRYQLFPNFVHKALLLCSVIVLLLDYLCCSLNFFPSSVFSQFFGRMY